VIGVAPGLWLGEGPTIRFWGIPFPTRMVVIQLANGGLWLHSPIAASPELVAEVAALGPVRHLVAPNWVHYAFLPGWQAQFPDAKTWAAAGVRQRASRRQVEIRWDADLATDPPPTWSDEIDMFEVKGHPRHREWVFLHRSSRSLVVTDLVQALEPDRMTWREALLARLLAGTRPGGAMPRLMRLGFALSPGALGRAVQHMVDWRPERLIYAHGPLPTQSGEDALRAALL
jgi:hypothetical protein